MTLEYTATEDLGHGTTRRYCYEGQIVVYAVTSTGRGPTDSWVNAALEDFEVAYAAGRPVYALHDMRQSGTSRYGINRTREMFDVPPQDQVMYAAVLVPNSMHGRMMQVSGELYAKKRPKFHIRFFRDYDKALGWLASCL